MIDREALSAAMTEKVAELDVSPHSAQERLLLLADFVIDCVRGPKLPPWIWNERDLNRLAVAMIDTALAAKNLPRPIIGARPSPEARAHEMRLIGSAFGLALHAVMAKGGDRQRIMKSAFEEAFEAAAGAHAQAEKAALN